MSTPLERFQERQRLIDQQAYSAFLPAKQEAVVEPPGFFSSMSRGLTTGLLEPLGIIPGVGGFLDRINDESTETLGGKLGYGVGWLGGFMVPSTAALKIGAKALQAGKLIKTADAFSNLGMARNLARGAIAGSILGAGREAEDLEERVSNAVTEAAMFGVGDTVGHLIFRGISGAASSEKLSPGVRKVLEKIAVTEKVETPEESSILGRALSMADDLFKEADLDTGARTVEELRRGLRFGLEDMGLESLKEGEIVIKKGLDTDASHLKGILNRLGDKVDAEVIHREVGGLNVSDVLVAPKGTLDERAVSIYKQNLVDHGEGFIPGQLFKYKGGDYYILGTGNKPGVVKVRQHGNRSKVHWKHLQDGEVMPYSLNWLGPHELENAPKHWAKFVEEFGDLPGLDSGKGKGFEWAYKRYLAKFATDLNEAEAIELKQYLAEQVLESMRKVDGDLYKALKKRRGDTLLNKHHVEGQAAVQAIENGYMIGTRWSDELEAYEYILRDVFTGNSVGGWVDEQGLVGFIKENPRRLENILPADLDPELAVQHLGLPGVSVPVLSKAATQSAWQFKASRMLQSMRRFMPRLAYVRAMNDAMIRTAPELYMKHNPGLHWERLMNAVTRSRRLSDDFLRKGYYIDGVRRKSLSEIMGGKHKTRIRPGKGSDVIDVLQSPRARWEKAKKLHKLNDEEMEVVKELRTYFNDMFNEVLVKSEHIDINADRFIENYFPHLWQSGKSQKNIDELIKQIEKAGVKNPDPKTIKFIHEMRRTGRGGEYMRDPFHVALIYTRGAFAKAHMSEPFEQASKMIRGLLNDAFHMQEQARMLRISDEPGKNLEYLGRSMMEYLHATYGNAPEHYYLLGDVAKGIFRDLNVEVADEISEKQFDRIINSLAMLNYGAFMAYRPVLALRNLTQTFVVTMPMVGPRNFLHGMSEAASNKALWKEAVEADVIPIGSIAAPMADRLHTESLRRTLVKGEGVAAKGAGLGVRAIQLAKDAGEFGLAGKAKVKFLNMEATIPVGFYTPADHFNRVVSYAAQKRKALKAAERWRGSAKKGIKGHKDIAKFNYEAGLTQFGETHTVEFHRKVATEGIHEAIKWSGRMMANETQWVYQLGAGPALFTHGAGRLFGMYGTWPSWYISHLARGLNRGTKADKAKFVGWTALAVSALSSAGFLSTTAARGLGGDVGVNLSRWSPMNSFTWAGGPFVDQLKDFSDVVSGGTGAERTARSQLALSERGLKDRGRTFVPGGLDPRRGHGIDIEDPFQLAVSTLGLFTPGGLAMNDARSAWRKAKQGRSASEVMLEFAGFEPISAYEWPTVQIRGLY